MFLYCVLLIIIGLVDCRTQNIPNELNIAIVISSIPLIGIQQDITIVERLMGALIVSLFMLFITVIVGRGFGGGDIKMMAASGLVLGVMKIIVAGCIGCVCGGVYISYLMIIKKKTEVENIVFGPFLSVGCIISLLYGNEIIGWYIQN